MLIYLKNKFFNFLNKGTELVDQNEDIRLVKFNNFVILLLSSIIFPLVMIGNIIEGDWFDLAMLFVVSIFTLLKLYFNRKGKSQLALLMFVLIGITVPHIVVAVNSIQTAAPYMCLISGFSIFFFYKNTVVKLIVFLYGFISFGYLLHYQLNNYQFDTIEFIIVLMMFMVFAVSVFYIKVLLNNQNKIINENAEQLLKLTKEKYEQELTIQQKDGEILLANNLVQIQFGGTLIKKLKKAQKSEVLEEEIKTVILELQQQKSINEKLSLSQLNFKNLNSVFYDNLTKKHPKITRVDKEFCSYLMLGMSSKEMAIIRSTTVNTVDVAKTRLRKKLGLETNKDLSVYLATIKIE